MTDDAALGGSGSRTAMDADETPAAWLVAAETALGRRDPDWPGGVASLLDKAFMEVGASGRTWDRTSVERLISEPVPPTVRFDQFAVHALGDGVALVTYRTVEPKRVARRVSVWIRAEAGWRLRYHQGTVIPGSTAD